MSADGGERAAFAERIRLQLKSRYRAARVEVDGERFALRVTGDGLDATLPLAPLQQAVLRDPAHTPALIARFVTGVETQLTPRAVGAFSVDRLVWCVRSRDYMRGIARASELLVRDMPADLVAFVAETLPASSMRGVPRGDWVAAGLQDAAVEAAVDRNTEQRFAHLAGRIRNAGRIPADGWRMAGDHMFQGSALLVPAVLAALAERAAGAVLLAVPDRGVVLALPSRLPSASVFDRRVTREWRESMNPCSHEILETDGVALRRRDPGNGRRAWVFPWLSQPWSDGGALDG
ncbi:MAG: hypothetical protein JOZ75_09250 [Candidatus Dormibacteraeota bacterium]|nr:hypothetical protein [Candidatus Dormibacteraeota bacterium]